MLLQEQRIILAVTEETTQVQMSTETKHQWINLINSQILASWISSDQTK